MITNQKLIFLCLYRILEEYSDDEHTLTQKEIGKKLKTDYDITINRKTLSRALKTLAGFDEKIRYTVLKRSGEDVTYSDDEEGLIYTNYYLIHPFERAEIQAVIDNIAFARHISPRHKKDMIKKLAAMGPISVRRKIKNYIYDRNTEQSEYGSLFFDMEKLDTAIDEKKVIRFRYSLFGDDLQMHTGENIWNVFPFGIVEKDNDYYLLGLICESVYEAADEYIADIQKKMESVRTGERTLDTFRIDRMKNLKVTDNTELSLSDRQIISTFYLKSINNSWYNIGEYVRQNRTLRSGKYIEAEFRFISDNCDISDVVDFFGKENIRIEKEGNGYIFTVKTNDIAMTEFAKSYMQEVEIIKPVELRNKVRDMFRQAFEKMNRS